MAAIDLGEDVDRHVRCMRAHDIRYLLEQWSSFSPDHRESRCREMLQHALADLEYLNERCWQLERAIETEGRLPVGLVTALREWKEGG